jgi:hypothetical protein
MLSLETLNMKETISIEDLQQFLFEELHDDAVDTEVFLERLIERFGGETLPFRMS